MKHGVYHACYNNEISLIKLIAFLFNVYKRFLSLSRFYVFLNMNVFLHLWYRVDTATDTETVPVDTGYRKDEDQKSKKILIQ